MGTLMLGGVGFLVTVVLLSLWRLGLLLTWLVRLAVHTAAVAVFWAGLWYCRAWRSRRWWLVVALHSPVGAVAMWLGTPLHTLPEAVPVAPVAWAVPVLGLVAALARTVWAAGLVRMNGWPAAARATPASGPRAVPSLQRDLPHCAPFPFRGRRGSEEMPLQGGPRRGLASEAPSSGGMRRVLPAVLASAVRMPWAVWGIALAARGVPKEPPERAWLVPDLVPCGPRPVRPLWHPWRPVRRGYLTGIAGSRGSGKSWIALALALALLTGREWLGIPAKQVHSVLWTDFELDTDEFWSRAYALARGMGLPGGRPPRGLHYLNLCGLTLAMPTPEQAANGARALGQERIRAAIARYRPAVVLNDSLTLGSGVALTDAEGWARTLRAMEAWGVPCVTIDHTSKASKAEGGGKGSAGAHPGGMIGSFGKEALVRSVLTLERQANSPGGETLRVRHTKSNFGKTLEPFEVLASFVRDEWDQLEVSFLKDALQLLRPARQRVPIPLDGAERRPSTGRGREVQDERVVQAFRGHESAVSPKDIALATGYKSSSVANSCTRLKERGLLVNPSRGMWQAVS